MRLMLTPQGPSDSIVELIPPITGFIPQREHVRFLWCNDGKDLSSTCRGEVNKDYYARLFLKLCTRNNDTVRSVCVTFISFFDTDDDFCAKLNNCDVFFMAGFTTRVQHVEAIYRRQCVSMMMKRMELANRVVTNRISLWAVCGSAVCCGNCWNYDGSLRTMPNTSHEFLGILADGQVWYHENPGRNHNGPLVLLLGPLGSRFVEINLK